MLGGNWKDAEPEQTYGFNIRSVTNCSHVFPSPNVRTGSFFSKRVKNYIMSQKLTRVSIKAFLQISIFLSITPFLTRFSKMCIKTEMENQPLTTFASFFFLFGWFSPSQHCTYTWALNPVQNTAIKQKLVGRNTLEYGCINESTAMV